MIANADLVLFLVLLAGAFSLLHGQAMKSDDAIATLVGALLGGAALLLGNWINRWNDRRRSETALNDQRAKLKALIAAELVNVAAGLIGAKRTMDAAIGTAEAGGTLPTECDLSGDSPRPMPFTDSLGSELSVLETRDLDVLVTLRANLAVTTASMDEISRGKRLFGWLVARQLHGGIRHDLQILAEAFQQFAPTRKLALDGKEPEYVIALLSRLAAEMADPAGRDG